MKLLHFQLLLSLCFCFFIAACSDNNDDEPKITAYQEYEITVASKQLLGVAFSSGRDQICKVYAVKKDGDTEWKSLPSIKDFEYEKGYEYRLKISKTSYLDNRMGDPAWTEFKLLEIKSKKQTDTKGLPSSLLPERYSCLDVDVHYFIEADKEKEVEDYLFNIKPSFVCDYYVFDLTRNIYAMIKDDTEQLLVSSGSFARKRNEDNKFPESYKLIPIQGQVEMSELWAFTTGGGALERVTVLKDAFYVKLPGATGNGPSPSQLWLYQDLTEYLQKNLPNAGVKTVVVAQISKIPNSSYN